MEGKIDIVKLIEKNPITRLSHVYQNTLVNKIKERFTDSEQQLFAGSFYCYLNYDSKKDFVVDLDNVWKWIGFSRKGHAKTMVEKHFVEEIDFKILLPQLRKQNSDSDSEYKKKKKKEKTDNDHGGNNKEQIMMTVHTFKKFCLKAGTNKADDIHEYFIGLEELLQETINEETNELRNQLMVKDTQLAQKDTQHKRELKMKKHKTLIEILKTKNCVYVGEIEENKFIKIGSSKEINYRAKSLNEEYNDLIFLEVFDCNYFRQAEEDILNDSLITKHLYRKPIKKNGKVSREVVQLSDDFNYDQLLAIVKKYIDESFTNYMTPTQLLEKYKIDFEKYKLDCEITKLAMNNDKFTDFIQKTIEKTFGDAEKNKDKYQDLLEEKTTPDIDIMENVKRNRMKPAGRKIQKIDPNNIKNIIKVYDSMVYLLRSPENIDINVNKHGLQVAIKNNDVYKGYRWNFVEKDEDPNISKAAPTANKRKEFDTDIILQLNETKTEIVGSFYTKKEVKDKFRLNQPKLEKLLNGDTKYKKCYFVKYKDCPPKLLENYDGPNNRVILAQSKQIKQIHATTKEETIFNNLNEISIKLGFKYKTIKNAIENRILVGGSIWKYCDDDMN
jgi:MSV199 domain